MVTTNQKPTKDKYRTKRKECKQNTEENQQTTIKKEIRKNIIDKKTFVNI